MNRTIIVSMSLAATIAAAGCGGGAGHALTVPASANSKRVLPSVEPVRGSDYERQALEGTIARVVQWGNRHYGKTVLDLNGKNTCEEKVEDLWNCTVTIKVVTPPKGFKASAIPGGYTVTRDTKRNRLVFIEGLS
jgi:hypothetical protein